mgnify:CR=1 FL=1
MAKKIDIEKEYLKLVKDSNLSLDQQIAIEEKIQNYRIKSVKSLKEELDAASKIAFEANIREKKEEQIRNTREKNLRIQQDSYDLAQEMTKDRQAFAKGETNIFNTTKDQAKSYVRNMQLKKEELQYQLETGDLTDDQANAIIKNIGAIEENVLGMNNLVKVYEEGGDKVEKLKGYHDEANKAAQELGSSIDGLFDKIPGGGFLAKALGLNDATQKLQKGVNAGMSAMVSHISQGGTMMGGLTAGMKAFNAAVMLNPLLLVVAAGAALFTMLSKAEAKERELSEATGLTLSEARALTHETEQYVGNPLKRQLATSEDILAVQSEMISNMGNMGKLQTGVAQQVAESGKAFGYGAKQAAAIQQSFMSMGASGQEAADAQDELAANALKAGVNVGRVMKDVAENSEDAMRYMGGNVEEIGKAAIKAAKLGVNLKTMTKVADKLLDIEGSLTAQFEFQALSGKQINLDKARQLALEGDIAGATEQVFQQVGSIAEFNKMSRFEREKLAEATGMEVGEIAKGLALQEKRAGLTDDQMAAAAGLNLSAEQLAKMSAEEIKAEITKQRAAEKSTAAFQELITSLKTAFMPLAEALGSILSTFAPLLQLVSIPLKLIGKVFGFLFNGMGVFSSLLKGVVAFMALKWMYSKLIAGKGGLGGLAGKITGAIKGMFGFNKEAKAAADSTGKINNDMDQAGKSAKSLKDRFKGMKASIGGLFKKGGMKNLMGNIKGGVGGLVQKAGGLGGIGKMALGGGGMMMASSLMSGGSAIPGFATGGEVGSTGIAKVHEGETITPASKVPGSEPGGGNGGGIDYDKMTQAFIAAMQQMPAPQVNMDGKAVSDSISAQQSYDRGIK